jgi:hypothetical protein
MTTTPAPLELQQITLAALLGHALSTWARVEEELCLVFEAALNTPNPFAARACFYAVRSFEARLDVVHAAITSIHLLPVELSKEWKAIHNNLRRKARARNQLAHSAITNISVNGGPMNAYIDPFSDTSSRRKLPLIENVLTQKQMEERLSSFWRLAEDSCLRGETRRASRAVFAFVFTGKQPGPSG